MSTAPRYEPHYSVADYLQWEGDWELWSGTAVAMSPSPLGPHERAAAKLVFQIESCLQSSGCPCASYAGLDWIVTDDTVVQPDEMVVCGSQPGRHLERPTASITIGQLTSPRPSGSPSRFPTGAGSTLTAGSRFPEQRRWEPGPLPLAALHPSGKRIG